LWLVLFAGVGWLAYFKIVPSGRISYVYDFDKPSYFIGKLTPVERVKIGQGGAIVRGDPVYFSLHPPRRFTRADVAIKFKNVTDLPVMEIGLLNDKVAWGYDLKPLENKIIEQLALVWPVVYNQNGTRLIERQKKYDTIEKFLSNLPEKKEIALYDYSLKDNFLLNNYEPQSKERLIDCGLRGSYQFYTYIKNETLNYTFNFFDLNLNKDNDPIDIKVYSPDGLIYSKHLADDAAASSERQISFQIVDLSEAVYRISLIANDDIITKSITTKQGQFALINKVWLASGNKKNLILYTNSRSLNVQTINPASLGEIKIGDDVLNLNQTYKQFSFKVAGQSFAPFKSDSARTAQDQAAGGVKIELAKDDIIISGDGVFSLKEDSLLDPRFKSVGGTIDINQEAINYVLTNYQSPLGVGEWTVGRASFDLTRAYQENGKYQFLISIPGLKVEEANQGAATIREIRIDLEGTSLWQKIRKLVNRKQ
jgi:hypothetical protein